ncbi:ABC transporter ATP-binding protein [Streptomyces sp. NPDC059517]|uniref:ABC transporter ATP-binding protein n=1 Tax=Streptomyces sp. NPDC059517 TaxID=3346855 RepID=UPI0036B3BDC5
MSTGAPPPAHPAVRLTGLRKRYGATDVVSGLTFDLARGEFFGLLGANGAGKTTTISVLCGLLRHTAGEARVFGDDVRTAPRAVQQHIGYVPQQLAVLPPLTPRQNLRWAASLHGVPRREIPARVDAELDRLDLGAFADRRAATLSGGEQRRVNIAMALVHRPRLLVLDEPTANVDVLSRLVIQRILRDLHRDGTTVLYTTHYLEEAQELCQRVGIIDSGRLVALGAVEELMREHGTGMLRIRTEHEIGTQVREAVAWASGAGGVVQPDRRSLIVRCHDPQKVLIDVLRCVGDAGGVVAGVQVTPATLQSAFLAVTGREFEGA